MKHKYKIFFIITIQIGLVLVLFTLKKETKENTLFVSLEKPKGEENYILEQKELTITDKKKIKGEYPISMMYYASGKDGKEKGEVYPITYYKTEQKQEIPKGLKLTFQSIGSDQLFAIFRSTYPFSSLKEVGLSSIEENYQATELALIEFSQETAESSYSDRTANILSIRKDLGEQKINKKVFDKAQELVDLVDTMIEQKYDYGKTDPRLIMSSENVKRTASIKKNFILCGPYQFEVRNANIKEISITIKNLKTNEEVPLQIVDKNGNTIKDMKTQENKDYYFVLPKEVTSFQINYVVKINRPYVGLYNDQYGRSYAVKIYEEKEAKYTYTINVKESDNK